MVLSSLSNDFYNETLYPDWGQHLKIDILYYQQTTPYQELMVFKNKLFGSVLALDGVIQTTQADAAIYSEMMVHVPFLSHGKVKSVLIIGGGDGSVLQEALRYPDLKRAVVVELDEAVVSACRQYMPGIGAEAFDDRRVELVIQDAACYIQDCQERFDVIICDSTDPFGPGAILFSEGFYGQCKRCLQDGGIFINQNGVPFLQPEEIPLTFKNRQPHFKTVTFYTLAMPTYVGGQMVLGWASDEPAHLKTSQEVLESRLLKLEANLFYYTPQVHLASFALPAFMLRQIP